MRCRSIAFTSTFFLFIHVLNAQIIQIEPDNYNNGTVLNTIVPGVSLITAAANNQPHPPVPFNVTAQTETFGFAPTGTKVFAHEGVFFFNSDRRLRMDFSGLASFISLDFAGGISAERGRLEAYNSSGLLVDSYLTQFRTGTQPETMFVSRPNPDIAFAIAYVAVGDGSFGRMDNLNFSFTPVPEPATWTLGILGMLGAILTWRRGR